jgi:hypothetical protein
MTNVMHVLDAVHSTNPCNHDFVFLSFLMKFKGFSHYSSSTSQLWIFCKVLSFRWFIIIHNLMHVVDSVFVFFLSARLYIYYYEVVCFFLLWCCCFFFYYFFPQNVSLHLCLIWWNHIIIKLFHESWNQCFEKMSSLKWWSCWLIVSMLQQL